MFRTTACMARCQQWPPGCHCTACEFCMRPVHTEASKMTLFLLAGLGMLAVLHECVLRSTYTWVHSPHAGMCPTISSQALCQQVCFVSRCCPT
jgi:hypothetical protein